MPARAVILGLVLLCSGCTGAFFHPAAEIPYTPARAKLAYENVWIKTPDGERLNAWYLPAATAHPQGTVLLVHGNAGNIASHLGSVYWLPARGFNVLLFDYRGYGRSSGTPTLGGLHQDTVSALDYLLHRRHVAPDRLIVLGQSLGGAVAAVAMNRAPDGHRIAGLVLDSAFDDYRAIAREKLASFWLTWPFQYPASWTIDNEYRPLDAVQNLTRPKLFIGGTADRIVPFHHTLGLYCAAAAPKRLWKVSGATHIASLDRRENRDRLVAWMRGVLGEAAMPPAEPPPDCPPDNETH